MDNYTLKKLAKRNKSYCPLAFHEIYVDNAGRYRLCCHARPMKEMEKFEENKNLPFEYFFSDEMEDIREKMFRNSISGIFIIQA